MPLFRRKQQVTIEEFLSDYYDIVIIPGANEGLTYWEYVYSYVTGPSSFRDVILDGIKPALFASELTALHFEIFGLAVAHTLRDDKFILREIVFTRRYLAQKHCLPIWEAMLPYNRAVAESSINIARGRRTKRGWITFANKTRSDLVERWVENGLVDFECAARLANRQLTEISWENKVAHELLVQTLIERLDHQFQGRARFALTSSLDRFYAVAKDAIKQRSVRV
jgi:hypothetical protein